MRFRADAFRELARDKGAKRHGERAKLLGVNRSTLDRWNSGEQLPRLEVALAVAAKLGVPVEQLWELTPASAA